MKKTDISAHFPLVTIYKGSTANSNRGYSLLLLCVCVLMGTGFSSHCPSLKLKRCTAEKMPWKYNPLHSRKMNKQGHPNFQLVLVLNAGNGKRSVQGALGQVVDTEQWQEGWKGERRHSVRMAGLQGKLRANRLVPTSYSRPVRITSWPRALLSFNIWKFNGEVTLESSSGVTYFMS